MGEATYNNIYGGVEDTISDTEGTTPALAGAGGAGAALATPDSAPAANTAASSAAADADALGPADHSSAKRSSPGSLLRPSPVPGQRLSEPVSQRGRANAPSPLGKGTPKSKHSKYPVLERNLVCLAVSPCVNMSQHTLLNLSFAGSCQSGPWTRSQAASSRRRSTLGGDMTGRLLADDFEPDVRLACLLPDDLACVAAHFAVSD